MRPTTARVIFLLAFLLAGAAQALAEKRVALVIGNSAYAHTTPLANPKNDAGDLAAMLERLGFEVTLGLDLPEARFADLVSAFSDRMTGASVALLFYAGHGIQFQNQNYLVPIDARLSTEFRLKRETIALGDIIEQMEAQVPVSLVFLDACQNNPLAENLRRGIRGKGRTAYLGGGLARVRSQGTDTLITFAAAPGREAADGIGRNSPFTTALLKHIATPGVEVEVMLKRVTADVRASTGRRQEPERLSRLSREFYFKPRAIALEPKPDRPAPRPEPDASAVEIAFWNSVKDSTSVADLQLYLGKYPGGHFRDLARRRIEALSALPKARSAAPPKATLPLATIAAFVRSDYLGNSFSRPDIARLYAARVRYGGKNMSARKIVADKLEYARRWPSRLYRLKESTLAAAPAPGRPGSYAISFQYDFTVTRPGKTVSGTGRTDLVLDIVAGRPVIRSESHQTLSRY